jgi:hypothetical protein
LNYLNTKYGRLIKEYALKPEGSYPLPVGYDPEELNIAIRRLNVATYMKAFSRQGVGFIKREGMFIEPTSWTIQEPRQPKKPKIEPIAENYSVADNAYLYRGVIANPSGNLQQQHAYYEGMLKRLRRRYGN